MEKVRSSDGTVIAFERLGSGPPLVLVGGAFCDRTARVSGLPLARELAKQLTVFAYDRRGRGDSTDTAPYAVSRELEDLAAVLSATGAEHGAYVYGHSSGAILALEAALSGAPMGKLALYEPPLVLSGAREPMPPELPDELAALIATGDRSGATALFLTRGVGLPATIVEQRMQHPAWASLTAASHTLSYDARLTADPESIVRRAATLRLPIALFDGAKSQPWMRAGVAGLAHAIPAAAHVTLPDQTHDVDPRAIAPKLLELFLA
jgi:pimeloyl-ACP methyl ester carboxylesterase